MRLCDHNAELDFRDGGEVWLHFRTHFDNVHIQVELMRETLEGILEEMDRLRTYEDLMMKADEFIEDTLTAEPESSRQGHLSFIEDFIVFTTKQK